MISFKTDSKPLTARDKWVIALLAGLLFMLMASPFMFSAMNSITSSFGMTISSHGCPNLGGLVFNSIIFLLLVRLLMR